MSEGQTSKEEAALHPASFKDPASRVYVDGKRVLRGLRADAAQHQEDLEKQGFFASWQEAGKIVKTTRAKDETAKQVAKDGWAMVVEHEVLPMISYPYEWSFGMLKDAAMLTLELQEQAMQAGWTLKDATSFNIQFRGAKPVFIDIPSLQPLAPGAPWPAYRQFCMTFLYPLMLHAHMGLDFAPLLRAELEGVTPVQAARHLRGMRRLRRGVLTHVVFPAHVEASLARKGIQRRKGITQPDAVRLGLVRGLINLVGKLEALDEKTLWRDYESEHSYAKDDVAAKREFVAKAASQRKPEMVWDLGCNTGTYAKECANHADMVVASDIDHGAIERLYRQLKSTDAKKNILPLVINLANPSPDQGWAGKERASFSGRAKVDLVLCLALVHHLRITCGVPLAMILDWLRAMDAEVVIEFVGRDDEMTIQLLSAKSEQYDDYQLDQFEKEAGKRFNTVGTLELKGGKRKLYHLRPRA